MRISRRSIAILALACCACAAGGGGARKSNGAAHGGRGGNDAAGDSGVFHNASGNQNGTSDAARPMPPGCGNGVRTRDEACDDGNQKGGDGCSADCTSIETGYSCQPPGKPCRLIARCGDGVVAPSEACDDGGAKDGDGCSARCKIELGYACGGEPSACKPTTCGDDKREGIEGCDDGNELPFDGCSGTCQTEPACDQSGCSSSCGDGLVLDEDCDDGNHKDGDGCSKDCKVEAGFMCTTDASCEMQDGHCILRVPAIFRDFAESHPDFQVGCGTLTKGVVQDMLNAEGKPVLKDGSAACIQSADTFAEWYTDNANDATIVGELTLFENGSGGFVNRYGKNGEQFAGQMMFTNVVWGADKVGGGCPMCTPSAAGQCLDPCTPWNSTTQTCCADVTQMFYDGNPLFFPIDDAKNALTDMRYRAKIPAEYGYNGWPWEDAIFPGAPMHDFHFTTEVVYWFKYDAKGSAVLDFTGDDDVWVFVNRKLAVDLGAPHVPENGSVTIDGSSAAGFGLDDGKVYEIRVFHAERKTEGSSFKLTLSGFNTAASDCEPICGDGVVTAGEECDDGKNDGGYEECAKGCVLGASCGDGIVQDGEEDCDDGNRKDGDGCGSSCRNLMVD